MNVETIQRCSKIAKDYFCSRLRPVYTIYNNRCTTTIATETIKLSKIIDFLNPTPFPQKTQYKHRSNLFCCHIGT